MVRESIVRKRRKNNSYTVSLETREKMSKSQIGKNVSKKTRNKLRNAQNKLLVSGLWRNQYGGYIEDRSKLKQSEKKHLDSRYKDWMKRVKDRDGWKCCTNDEDCKGRLEAHHILPWRNYPKLRYKINNGITLCQAHHPRGEAKEKELAPMLMEIVSSKG